MTLLHTMIAGHMAALRGAEMQQWPAGTHLTPDDVLISGASLTELARELGTPAILCGTAGTTSTGADAPGSRRSVVLVAVDSVIPPLHKPREVWVDAEIEGCSPVLSAVRLLGHTCRYRLRPGRSDALAALVHLPADLRRHDLLAIPCRGSFALEEIER